MQSNLLATKLHRPSTPATWIQRPHLVQKLNEGLHLNRQITLVSAPAGFGKTTCISEWINAIDVPVTWLSLDMGDDDPGRFFTYFISALQKVNRDLGQEVEAVLRAGQVPPSEVVSTILINDILSLEEHFLLVLDDFHAIQDRFILEVLEKLIANLPQQMHLVLVTREDPPLPLAQLRASNRLTEIRARDLRFSNQDIEHFLNETMGLSLSNADIDTLANKTEGWIVGLQLAGLSMRDRDEPSGFITSLSGSHRFILSYLTEQVISHQPEEIQYFLLQTSILDKLNGELCDAVTGRADSRVMLEKLFNANLFLIPLDDEGGWYRYHHLFADLLRTLQKTRQEVKTTELHQRASRWFSQAGMVGEAIEHALAAEDYGLAVGLIESHAMKTIMQGYIKTVSTWAQAIPDEWSSRSPRTNLALAWTYLLRGDYAQASPYLERLQSIPGEDPSLIAEWLALQSLILYNQGQAMESKDMALKALEAVPKQDSRVRSLAQYALASAYWLLADYPNAIDAYRISIQYGRAGKNPMAETLSTVALAGMLHEHGQLQQAFEIASQAVERIERSDTLLPISAVVYAALGDVHYQWHQLTQARDYFQRALHLSALGGSNTVTIFCHVLLSRLSQLEGDLETATREIQKAANLVPVEAPEYTMQEVVSQQVCIYLAHDRPSAAEMALQRYGFSFDDRFLCPDLQPDTSISYATGLLYNSSLRILLYQARAGNDPARLKSGIELASLLIRGAIEAKQLLIALETLLLRAQMHATLDEHQASQTDYVNALELAQPEGFIGVFVEHGQPVAKALADLYKRGRLESLRAGYIERILEAFSRTHPSHGEKPAPTPLSGSGPTPLIDPLTDRELDVLRLMAEGLKYKEIAEQLFISQNTVRYHVKAIYGKFSVNNRTQAIEKARQLQIM